MSKKRAASLIFKVSSSSALLGLRLPEGWLWQSIRLTAFSSRAFLRMILRIGNRAGDPAGTDNFKVNDLVGPVQEDYGKYFVVEIAEQCLQVPGNRRLLVTTGLSRFSVAKRRLPSSRAATMLMALASPIPLIFNKFTNGKPAQFSQVMLAALQEFPAQVDRRFLPGTVLNQNGQ